MKIQHLQYDDTITGGTGAATGAGTRVDVTLKLSQLQNLCKRDPTTDRNDYDAHVRRLASELSDLQLQPSALPGVRGVKFIQFAVAVSSTSYKGQELDHIGTILMSLLGGTKDITSNGNTTISTLPTAAALHLDVRKAAFFSLILIRNKGTVDPLDLL
jgi:protein SDA1